jgi:signal-transduction protein with cAMP-binding, CBS, and nucleotidyltransferase domain
MPTRTLQSIVSQRPLVIGSPKMSVYDAAIAMRDKGVGSVVIEKNGALAGIFTERDLLNRVVAAGKDPEKTTLNDVMTKDVIGLEGDKPLLHALHLMHQNTFRHVPVLQQGKPIGMVSARDALGIEWQQFQREIKLADDIAEILA